MTKDRRLGRGLAALLGTPIEEGESGDIRLQSDEAATNEATTEPSQSTAQKKSDSTSGNHRTKPTPRVQPVNGDEDADSTERSRAIQEMNREAKALVVKADDSRDSSPSKSADSTPVHESNGELSLAMLPVHMIDNNPFQPRRDFNESEIASLAESIKEHEQLQPILVRRNGDRYQLISGERRLRATKYAGRTTIRAEIRDADDRLVAELAIIENLQRKDLNAIEKALSFRRYLDEHHCTQNDLAQRLKIDRSTIANMMRLLELPPRIMEAVQSDTLTAGHAKALLPLGDETLQEQYMDRALEEGWSVRQVERSVAEYLDVEEKKTEGKFGVASNRRQPRAVKSDQIQMLEQELKSSLGTKVDIRTTARGRGKITIHFASSAEFDRIRDSLIAGPEIPQSKKKAA